MIRTRLRILAAFVAGATLAAAQQPSPSPQGNYSIRGVVVSAATGNPLDQAVVTLLRTEDRVKIGETATGEEGSFGFQDLRPGNYTLRASRRGYNSALYDEHENFFSGIVTGPGQDTTDLRFRLLPAAIISGIVTDDVGDPVRNAQVFLYRKRTYDGLGKIAQSDSRQTDDIGAFEFAGLAPDDYFVSVSATPWYAVHPQIPSDTQGNPLPGSPSPNSPLDVAYPLTFYAGTTESDDATPIPLRPGDHMQVNLSLHALPAIHLRINIQDAAGKQRMPVTQLTQKVFDAQVPMGWAAASNGKYLEMVGVAPGHYNMGFAGGQASELDLTTSTTLDPPPPAPQVTVRGEVAMANGEKLPRSFTFSSTLLPRISIAAWPCKRTAPSPWKRCRPAATK